MCIRIRRKQLEETHYINTSVIRKNVFVAIGLLQNKWQRVSSRTNDNTKQGSKKTTKAALSQFLLYCFFLYRVNAPKRDARGNTFQTYQIGAYWNPCEISLQLFLFAILSISSSKIISHKPSDDEHLQSKFNKHFNNKIQMNFCFVIFSKKDFFIISFLFTDRLLLIFWNRITAWITSRNKADIQMDEKLLKKYTWCVFDY